MNEIDDSLARGLQKRLRREFEQQAYDWQCKREKPNELIAAKSRKSWHKAMSKQFSDRFGPFVSRKMRLSDDLTLLFILQPYDGHLWCSSMVVIDAKRFTVADTPTTFVSNHAIERYFQRSCSSSEALSFLPVLIQRLVCEFQKVIDIATLIYDEKFIHEVECTINTDKGSYFLARKDGRVSEDWVIKSFLTSEIMGGKRAESWSSGFSRLNEEVNSRLLKRFGEKTWKA